MGCAARGVQGLGRMAAPSTRVLLVEDDAPLRTLVAEALREDGYAVEEAADGREALDAMRRAPDVVVLDLQMPHLDGPGFMRVLRDQTRWGRVPVLVFSGAPRADAAAARLGAEALVRKPFDLDELLGTVHRVSRARTGAESTPARPAVALSWRPPVPPVRRGTANHRAAAHWRVYP